MVADEVDLVSDNTEFIWSSDFEATMAFSIAMFSDSLLAKARL